MVIKAVMAWRLTQSCRDPLRSLAPHYPEEFPESSLWKLASRLALALRKDKRVTNDGVAAGKMTSSVLPVKITRLCCLCRMLFLGPLLSAGSSEGVSGRGSDLGSSGEAAVLLKPSSSLSSLVSSMKDLQGRSLAGCPS